MTKAHLEIILDMVNRQLLTAIEAVNPGMTHPEKRASSVSVFDVSDNVIELCWGHGGVRGVRIVRSSTQEPLMPRGTKREAHNQLRAMEIALNIAAGR